MYLFINAYTPFTDVNRLLFLRIRLRRVFLQQISKTLGSSSRRGGWELTTGTSWKQVSRFHWVAGLVWDVGKFTLASC